MFFWIFDEKNFEVVDFRWNKFRLYCGNLLVVNGYDNVILEDFEYLKVEVEEECF